MSKTRENFEKADPVTWLQIHNLLPILLVVFGCFLVYFLLSNKVERLEKTVQYQKTAVHEVPITVVVTPTDTPTPTKRAPRVASPSAVVTP